MSGYEKWIPYSPSNNIALYNKTIKRIEITECASNVTFIDATTSEFFEWEPLNFHKMRLQG